MVLATSSGQRAGWLPFVARAPTRCRACSLNRLVMSHEKRFVDRLNAGEILVADGPTATNYQQMGMAIGVAPEEWVFDEPRQDPGPARRLHRRRCRHHPQRYLRRHLTASARIALCRSRDR